MSSILDTFNSQTFTGQLHTKFLVPLQGMEPVALELVEVNERNSAPKIELFSLLFRGPHTPRLDQMIHALEHEKLGRFELFLTAITGDHDSVTYEAVFHRFRKDQ
ncbi:MAG TPA: hypothetical protein VNW97_18735 [Candidatus Saccharimonadales bacterium]|jgi:hypothetical protein|nr:hypothetical protein [Candidatus Saccharimonadales bacterium]